MWHFQCPYVEHDVSDGARRYFGISHTIPRENAGLNVEEVLRFGVARNTHILQVGGNGLLEQVDRLGLFAKAADVTPVLGEMMCSWRKIGGRIDPVGHAGNPVSVIVVRVGQGQQYDILDGFEITQARDGRRHQTGHAPSLRGDNLSRIAGDRPVL
jgi:hypothetical protein